LIVSALFWSCQTTESAAETEQAQTKESSADNFQGTPLGIPALIQTGFFSGISPTIMRDVEIGSPSSLRRAATAIRKSSGNYSLAESVLLNVCADVMRYAWGYSASLPVSSGNVIDKPEVRERNAYTGALDSVRLGVYDVSTGNIDFLTNALPSLILVTSSMRNDYYELAQRDLLSALSYNHESVLVHYLLGTLYKKMGNAPFALAEFQEALRLDSACFETQLALAQTFYGMEHLEDAERQTSRLLSSHPSNVDVLKLAAEIAYKQKNYQLAGDYVARVLQRESENAYYLLFRARILIVTGDYIKAASLLDAYSRTDRTSRDYLVLRARIQSEWNKNNTAAISTIEQALALYADDAELILYAARLASETGQKIAGKTAGDFARNVLQSDDGNTEALSILVLDAVKNRQWSEAYHNSRIIQTREPSLSDQIKHVEICLALSYRDEAKTLAESLYAKEPNDAGVREAYIKMLTAAGERQRARTLIDAWLPSARPAMKSFLYWQRSRLSNSQTDILNDLRLSLTSDPRNTDALMELYRYYYAQQDYRKAQYYLKQVVALTPNDSYILGLNAELERLIGN
jgi:Tfp pilus assembly protein PilF